MTQLLAIDGTLYSPYSAADQAVKDFQDDQDDFILIYYYPSGDVDTIKFPDFNADHLRGALYDMREQGYFPDCQAVLLPDGTEFSF